MLYLASPYSHPKSVIREVRYLAAMQACAYFHQQGITVHSPIVHWHNVAMMHKLPHDFSLWRKQCLDMMLYASKFGMLLLDGWEDSVGLKEEWRQARDWNLPIERYIAYHGEIYWVGEGLLVWPSTPCNTSANGV